MHGRSSVSRSIFMKSPTLVALLLPLVVGCEDRTPVVSPLPTPTTIPAVEEIPARPTTQSLLEGPRTRTTLSPMPISLDLPPGWALETVADTPVLNGPAPSGDLTVSLITRSVATKTIEMIERGAKEEAAAKPKTHLRADARTVNGVKIFERQTVGTGVAPDGSLMFRWHITVYAPTPEDAEATTTYEINFFGLSRKMMETDGPFIQSIIDSLELVGT